MGFLRFVKARLFLTLIGVGSTLLVLTVGGSGLSVEAQTTTTLASSCPILAIDSPGPGDFLPSGDHVVSGMAFDPVATDGPGVARVDLFLGHRESGGIFLGSAVPGQESGGNPRGFQLKITVPRSVRSDDLVAYAYSSVSGGQTSVAFPVQVGTEPTATPRDRPGTPVLPTTTVQTTCSGSSRAVQPVTNAFTQPTEATPVISQPQVTSTMMVQQPGPVLQLANPNPGDVLGLGASIVSGLAYDPTSQQGSGVDRVDLFLDSRESGGVLLGSVVPQPTTAGDTRAFQVTIRLARNATGAHDLVAYAHSALTGGEASV